MDLTLKKSFDRSRGLLFGLLANCILSTDTNENCPLSELRINLSIEEKYEYVMGLNADEIQRILVQHDECYEKKLSNFK